MPLAASTVVELLTGRAAAGTADAVNTAAINPIDDASRSSPMPPRPVSSRLPDPTPMPPPPPPIACSPMASSPFSDSVPIGVAWLGVGVRIGSRSARTREWDMGRCPTFRDNVSTVTGRTGTSATDRQRPGAAQPLPPVPPVLPIPSPPSLVPRPAAVLGAASRSLLGTVTTSNVATRQPPKPGGWCIPRPPSTAPPSCLVSSPPRPACRWGRRGRWRMHTVVPSEKRAHPSSTCPSHSGARSRNPSS